MTDSATQEPALYITDAELIRRLGVPEKVARQAIRMLDAKQTGFPRKQPFYGNRRYWPAVKRYFDKTNGLTMDVPIRSKIHE